MKKVYVALSGGVDSAVAAHKLQKDGWDVVGVFIRVWQPDFLPCSQDDEERAALRVAAHLGIPFKRLDLASEYKKEVVEKMVSEYKAGRTPNPDVLCNTFIKFGAFLDFAKKEGAEKIATGHHVRVLHEDSQHTLLRGVDAEKDQAYFLWTLSQNDLAYTLLPIGEMTKADVRTYAEKHNLPSAFKPDSQGLCFIGHVDMKTFLGNFITTEQGSVLDMNGTVIGTHEGAELVTLGQRGGFRITEKDPHRKAYYVVAKDITNNTITVSERKLLPQQGTQEIALTEVNWMHIPRKDGRYTCEIRYHGKPLDCRVETTQEKTIIFLKKEALVASGQSVVLYDNDRCLGGGVVV